MTRIYLSTKRRAQMTRDGGLFLSVFLATWTAGGNGVGWPALSGAASVAIMAVLRSVVPIPPPPTPEKKGPKGVR